MYFEAVGEPLLKTLLSVHKSVDSPTDIWESKADILASIANYFKEHGWKTGGPIFQKVTVQNFGNI